MADFLGDAIKRLCEQEKRRIFEALAHDLRGQVLSRMPELERARFRMEWRELQSRQQSLGIFAPREVSQIEKDLPQ